MSEQIDLKGNSPSIHTVFLDDYMPASGLCQYPWMGEARRTRVWRILVETLSVSHLIFPRKSGHLIKFLSGSFRTVAGFIILTRVFP